MTPHEYDVQKLKLSTGFGNPSELNRDLVVLVESSSPHQPSLVVEVEDSEVGRSRGKSFLDPIKGGEEQCGSSLFGARLPATRAKSRGNLPCRLLRFSLSSIVSFIKPTAQARWPASLCSLLKRL